MSASTLAYLEEAARRGAIGHVGTTGGGCCWRCDERTLQEYEQRRDESG